jgi:hypothetical protein
MGYRIRKQRGRKHGHQRKERTNEERNLSTRFLLPPLFLKKCTTQGKAPDEAGEGEEEAAAAAAEEEEEESWHEFFVEFFAFIPFFSPYLSLSLLLRFFS